VKKKGKAPSVTSVLFCGVGGQGVLTASQICGDAALRAGFHVKKSEVKGMSQRGGSVDSHVRFGKKVYSPLIPPGGADFLVPFNEEEGKRWAGFLKKEGTDLSPYLARAAAAVADKRFINTYMLGVLSGRLPFGDKAWFVALDSNFKRAQEENRRVFLLGQKEGKAK